jgi:hypothetical protein
MQNTVITILLFISLVLSQLPPGWEYEESDYEYFMTITGLVENTNNINIDGSWTLGAFNQQSCRGLVSPIYHLNQWMFFLMIHGNEQYDPVNLKLYNPVADTIFQILCPFPDDCNGNDFFFQSNETNGAPGLPILFHVSEDCSLDDPVLGCFQYGCSDGYDCVDDWEYNCVSSYSECDQSSGEWNIIADDCNGGICINQEMIGDFNHDGFINVIDIIGVVNYILNIYIDIDITAYEIWAGDFDSNSIINITDIVNIIQTILDNNLSKGDDPTYIDVSYNNNYITINSDGKIAGVQVEYTGTFNYNKSYLPEDWNVFHNDNTILIYSMSGTELIDNKLFDFNGEIELLSAIGSGWNGVEIQAGITLIPLEYALHPAYPNPFNPVTNISYALPLESDITLNVYDVEGRKITTLTEGIRTAGAHSVEWNAEGFPSGVYFVKLDAGEFTQTQKLMLVK